MSLTASISRSSDAVQVVLAGTIDEHAAPPLTNLLAGFTGASIVRFKIGKLTSINSFGAAAWVRFLDAIPPGVAYEFADAPTCFVSYACLTTSVLGRGSLVSCLVDYECDACDQREAVPLAMAGFDPKGGFPARACPGCGGGGFAPLIEAEDYFAFLGAD